MSTVAHFSLKHYEHMVDVGAFIASSKRRFELIRGKIVERGHAAPAKFSVEEYESMVRAGAFDPPFDLRAELIEGEIRMMSPIGEPHSQAIVALTEWSYDVVDRKQFAIRVQMPIRIPTAQSEPEPDLAWVRRGTSIQKPPEPDAVALIAEVADSSLEYDSTVKLSMYAEAGIRDYWIVNLLDRQIEVYRQPSEKFYQSKTIYKASDVVTPIVLPTAALEVDRLFQ